MPVQTPTRPARRTAAPPSRGVLHRTGAFAARRPWVVIGAWLAAALLVVGLASTVGAELGDSITVPGLDSTQAAELLTGAGFADAGLTAQVVATPADGDAFLGNPAATEALAELSARIAALPYVVGVDDPAALLRADPPTALASGAVSPDGTVALLRVQYPPLEELDVAAHEALVGLQGGDGVLRVEMGGELFFQYAEAEAGTGELTGLAVAVVVLLLAFGSVVAMGLPLGTALLGLAVGISSLSLVAHVVDVPAWSTQLATMVGLGVGIDYALFLVTRHREQLSTGMPVVASVATAIATSGRAVVFAGSTVVVSILGLAVADIPWVTAAGIAIAVVVLVTMLASLTLLPAFLGLAGTRVLGRRGQARIGRPVVATRWHRWGRHVADHAVLYTVGATTVLVALSAPVLSLRLGLPDDGSQPTSTTQRRAYDLVADGFGPGANGPLVIAVDTAGDPAVLDALAEVVAADSGVAGVAPPVLDPSSGVAVLSAVPTTSPQDEATVDTVARLRAEVLPSVLGGSPASAHVGGATATFADLDERVAERLPRLVIAVVALSFLLLVVVFRSVLVPLKAALLNLLSIGAAYGVLVAVFQWGWGASLIGLESTVPIISFIPMFMFAIVFGLSMDYEVFLLSRIREEHQRTGDNDTAVVTGLASTGRVITSAALIMIAVFLGFVASPDPSTKMFGLGLATAIAVDATIVRMVLVPATMRLLGEANWWLPAWLERLLPRIDLEGGVQVDRPARAPVAG